MSDRQLTLRISLQGAEPPIWRTFVLPSYHTLGELHSVAQAVMGWENCHLHEFIKGKRHLLPSDPELMAGDNQDDEDSVTVGELFPRAGSKVTYVYDFGDGWLHEVKLERAESLKDPAAVPRCLDGARACPPEDSGGLGGYYDKLRALAEPKDEWDREMVEWLGEDFDSEVFSVEDANDRIARLVDGDDDDDFDEDLDDEMHELLDLRYDPSTAPKPDVWLDADEYEQQQAIELYHFALPALERPPQLSLHAIVHAVVEHQIAANDPPETGGVVARLLKEGLDRHNAIHAVGTVVADRIFQTIELGVDPAKEYVEALQQLTAARWMSEHNTDPNGGTSGGSAISPARKQRRKKK